MIKAVLFDFDGVLTLDKTGSQSILGYLAQKTGLPMDKLKAEYYKYIRELLYGKLMHRDMWSDFCAGLGHALDFALLAEAFYDTPLDREMLRFVEELKKTYKTGMVTDNKCDRMEAILGHYRLHSLFDAVSVSARYGFGKEDRRIFDETLSRLQVEAEACVFIDNSEKNLVAPRQMGIHTIYFDDENRDIPALRDRVFAFIDGTSS